MSNIKYIRYDKDIWEVQDLSVISKLILNHIRSFEDKGLSCFTSSDLLAELYGVPKGMVDIALLELAANRYISMESNGNCRVVTIIWKKDNPVDDYLGSDIWETE